MPRTPPSPMRLRPGLQHYAWGDDAFIPRLFGLAGAAGPYAEAWLGAHPARPATLDAPGGPVGLDAAIRADAAGLLGEAVAARFGGLPYLMKVLAAARPLSIQVHPSRAQAEEGFARESAAGVPLDAPHRSYRDASPKPELLVALTPFDALVGFRAPAELARLSARFPELRELLPRALPGGSGALRDGVRAHLERPAAAITPVLARLHGRLRAEDARAPFPPDDPAYWFLVAAREHAGPAGHDRGLLFIFLLELVHLAPGQGIFLPAGVVHAYLRGAGLELMASSDNVLRCGLTPKHVDAAELLRITDFDARRPELLEPLPTGAPGELAYRTAAEELCLSRIDLAVDGPAFAAAASGPETLLVVDAPAGPVRLEAAGGALELPRGAACLIPAGTSYQLRAPGSATLFRAGVPAPAATTFRGRQPARLAFGTSGLRGLVSEITDLEAYVDTRGFLAHLVETGQARPGAPVALGGDLRPSTDGPARSILRAVARATTDAGFRAVNCGLLPTPALTLHGLAQGWPSVMVTGSHIPFDRNGIKLNKPDGEVLKADEAPILAAVERVRREVYACPAAASPFADDGLFRPGEARPLPPLDRSASERYVERYLAFLPPGALAGQRVAFYEHSAVGRELIPALLRALGATVHPVGRTPGFVALDTEAIPEARLAELQALAAGLGPLDALVSTDGDSDRPLLLVPDRAGRLRFCGGDLLGLLVADLLGADAVAVPVSSSDAIELHLAPRRVAIARTRIGSPHVIAALAALPGRRKVGWEANGGFLVGTELEQGGRRLAPLPTRDSVLPLVTVLAAAARSGAPVHALLERLPRRYGRAGLLDAVPADESRALIERLTPRTAPGVFEADLRAPAQAPLAALLARTFTPARGFGAPERLSFLDGVRVTFANGDLAHVRPSGNAPQLRIYAIADTEERASAIVAMGIAEPDGLLRQLLGAA